MFLYVIYNFNNRSRKRNVGNEIGSGWKCGKEQMCSAPRGRLNQQATPEEPIRAHRNALRRLFVN